MTEEAPNFTEQSWFVGQDVKNKDSHVNLLFDLKRVIASVGKTESWTVQMQFLVFVEAANDTNARCRWTGRSRWRRTAAPRSAGRSPTAPPSLWRAGTDWKRAREGVSERGERNNKGIQLLWTRQGQWLQSWHCLSTLVRLLLTQLNPALRLIWLLGAIRSRILMLIKSPAGTEASTEKKKGSFVREPVWKSSCGLCHSLTIFRVEGADSAVFVLAGGAPTQTQFKLLQWFIWTVPQRRSAARTSVWTGRECSPSIMSRASAGGRGRASLECTGWGIRGGRSAPCWPPPRSCFPRAGLYPEGSPLCYC